MFGHGQAAKVHELEQKVRSLELDIKALARDHLDLDACVAKWMKRDRERERRAGAGLRPGAGAFEGSREAPTPGNSPPPSLRGARLRIWQRTHGRSVNGQQGTPALDGEPVAHPLNELGNELEVNGDG